MRFPKTWILMALGAVAPSSAAVVAQDAPKRWVVGAEPTVSIGAIDGTDEEMLVNVLMGAALSDGTIVLRNSIRGTFEIRYYAPDGSHIVTSSRFGQGPYEFRRPMGVHRIPGDSILVLGEDGRFAVFGPRGERSREGRMDLHDQRQITGSYGVDHARVVFDRYSGPSMPQSGTRRAESVLYSKDLATGVEDSIGVVLSKATHYERMTDRSGVRIFPAPFAPETFVAVGAGLVWVGDGAEDEIVAYRIEDGTRVITITSPFEPRRVTRGDRSRTREALAGVGQGENQTRWARYAREAEFPDRMPHFGALEVDRSGNVWVQEYEPFWADGEQRWAVFAPSGDQLAYVSVPAAAVPFCARRLRSSCSVLTGIFEIGDDYLLVAQSDEGGVRYLRQYPIVKPS